MKKILPLIAVILFWAPLLAAYSTPNVPIDDPVYRDIDKLVAAGLVKDLIYGQRPWSRGEIARIISVAIKNQEDDRELSHRLYVDNILERLKSEFREELIDRGALDGESKGIRVHPLEAVRLDYTLLDSPFRTAPPDNNVGAIDAVVNPLVAHQEGRHFVDGNTLALETTHRANLSKYFSLYLRPRFEVLIPNTSSNDVNPIVQQLYGKFAWKNFEIEAGRDSLIWGHGEFGGVTFSNNARPLDLIKLTSSSPFHHPWIFKYLGPSKYTFFVGNLGPEREFPYTFVYGFQASFRPVHFIEFGFDHVILMGGDGAPAIKWYDPISEFFFVRRGGVRGEGSQVADHRFGGNWRLKIPPLRNAEWYLETIWDDFGRETVEANITEQMAFTTGLYFPRLTADGAADLRIEFSHIPPIVYRHGTWKSGYTLNRLLLGNKLGPDSDQIKVVLQHDLSERHLLRLELGYGNIDSDIYTQTPSSKGGPDRVVKVTDNPTEHRWLAEGGLSWRLRKDLRLELQVGYEHVVNFNFDTNSDIDNFLGSSSLIWQVDL